MDPDIVLGQVDAITSSARFNRLQKLAPQAVRDLDRAVLLLIAAEVDPKDLKEHLIETVNYMSKTLKIRSQTDLLNRKL